MSHLRRLPAGIAAVAVVCALAAPLSAQSTWFVDDDAPSGGDGKTWATAFSFLQDALGAAANGDTIEIAGGTYLPDHGAGHVVGSKSETFVVGPGTTLRGGYRGLAGGGSPDDRDLAAFRSILSGDLAGDDPNWSDNSQHVVTTGATGPACTFDGIEIVRGVSPVPGMGGGVFDSGEGVTAVDCSFTDSFGNQGGAIWSDGGTIALTDCSLLRNLGNLEGGAISVSHATLTLTGCTVDDNIATGSFLEGGAIRGGSSTITITGCTFERNIADHGGAVAIDKGTLVVSGSTFRSHQTSFNGGGLWISNSTATVDECLFDSNHDTRLGGGIYAWRTSTATVTRCQFTHNHADDGGAAAGDPPATVSFADCLFDGNDAGFDGGAIVGNILGLTRCTFRNNTAINFSALDLGPVAGVTTDISDCLFYGNDAREATVYVEASPGFVVIERCTIADNSGQNSDCGGLQVNLDAINPVVVSSTILWGNTAFGFTRERHNIYGPVPKLDVNWCCIDGWSGRLGGIGNHGSDPLFVDDGNGDFSLEPSSPCVEGGDPAFDAPAGFTRDVAGNCRLLDAQLDRSAIVDQGAVEFTNIRCDLAGSPTPGGTVTIVSSGTNGIPLAMLVGLAPAELAAPHYGTLFLNLGSICLCIPWPSAPSSVDVQIPADAPLGPIYLQEFAMSGAAGNLSDLVVFDIE
jgi:hypothetical protein